MKSKLNTKSIFQIIAILLLPLFLSSCVKATLAWADLNPKGVSGTPPILAANFPGDEQSVTNISDWENRRKAAIRVTIQDYIYGYMPDSSSITVLSRKTLDRNAFGGRATLEEITITATATFGTQSNVSRPIIIELIVPKNADGPVPLILKQSFSRRWSAVPHPAVTGAPEDGPGSIAGIFKFVFGRYIATPPLSDILDRGYAIAIAHPSEFIPDNPSAGLKALADLSKGHNDDATRWGTIGAWGWAYSRMIDAVIDDPRIKKTGFSTYGHSRYGKAALVAAAFDDRISAVISHQSGTGGASLNRRKKGETVTEITQTYPHWFSQNYAAFAGRETELPIDQHHLLSLLAPRPVMLGNARRDVWSDPNGALKAAIAADPVWKLYGPDKGLRQSRLRPFMPEAELALWLRPGTHGVVKEDWPAFLDFLDAHL